MYAAIFRNARPAVAEGSWHRNQWEVLGAGRHGWHSGRVLALWAISAFCLSLAVFSGGRQKWVRNVAAAHKAVVGVFCLTAILVLVSFAGENWLYTRYFIL
jgi:hypothetical protein